MVDITVQRFIEQTIDSPLKLQLLLLFCEHSHTQGTAAQIAQRIYRDIWSTNAALRELAEDGVLAISSAPEPVFHYHPSVEHMPAIMKLYKDYNEPIERDHLQHMVREVAEYAPYRRAALGTFERDRAMAI